MKRLVSVMLAAALLLACIPFTVAAAAKPTLSVDGAVVGVGDTFTVAVRIADNSGISKLKMWVSYDASVLQLDGYEVVLPDLNSKDKPYAQCSAGNPCEIYWDSWTDGKQNIRTNGVIANLTFRVITDAPCITTLRVDYNDKYTAKGSSTKVACATESSTVCIGLPRPGDADGDGKLNNKDLALLQQYLAAWSVTVDAAAADVYGDDKLNNKDLALMQRYLAGWDVTLAPAVDDLPTDRVITLPEMGTDIDVSKQKNRIRVKDAFVLGDTVFMMVYNSTTNWITEEIDWIKVTCYDANGAVLKTIQLYIGAIDTKKNSQKIYVLDAPAGTTEIKITESKITYWTEWA